jgi:hypothetical protein
MSFNKPYSTVASGANPQLFINCSESSEYFTVWLMAAKREKEKC